MQNNEPQKTFSPYQVFQRLPPQIKAEADKAIKSSPDLMSPDTSKKLKVIFNKCPDFFAEYGLLPDYFTYALIFVLTSHAQAQQNLRRN